MATDETDASRGNDRDEATTAAAQPSSSDPRAEEEEGWPRSWIVITSVLGIVAIIVVARIAGQGWRADLPGPVGPPPTEPGAGPEPREGNEPAPSETTAADVKDVEIKQGHFCIGKDGKPWAFAGSMADGPLPPAECRIPTKGASLRLEILRADVSAPIVVKVFPAIKDAPPLLHAYLVPGPDPLRPTWFATNQGAGMELVILVENPVKTPMTLKRVRLLVRQ